MSRSSARLAPGEGKLASHASGPGPANTLAILIVITLSSFLSPFAVSSVNVALPLIGEDFAMNATLLGWIATAYLLASAVFLVPFGKVADMGAKKRVFVQGVVVFGIASLVSGLAASPAMLIAVRVVQGIGAAMMGATGIAILVSHFPERERGRVLGINVAATYIGLSLGPFLGGVLAQRFGWRSTFLVNVPLCLAVALLAALGLPKERVERGSSRFDLFGSVTYAIMLLCIVYGFSILPSSLGAWMTLLGVMAGILFVFWELRAKAPVVPVALFAGNRPFVFSNLAALINYSATFSSGFLLSLYLQYVRGFSPQYAGLVLAVQPMVQAAFSPLAGRISDRIEPQIVASAGMGLTVAGLLPLSFLGPGTELWVVVKSLAILGLGFAFFSSPNTHAVMASVERRSYAVASAVLGTMRVVGQSMIMGTAMLVLASYVGGGQLGPSSRGLLPGIKTSFVIFAALCLGGVFASLVRGKIHQDEIKPA